MAELTLTGPVPQDVPDEPPQPIYNEKSTSELVWNEHAESGEQRELVLNSEGISPYCIDPATRCYKCRRRAGGMKESGCDRHWGANWKAKKMCNQRHTDDSDDILALPTINWAEPIDQPTRLPGDPVDAPGITFNDLADYNSGPVTNAADEDDVLRLPVVNWSQNG